MRPTRLVAAVLALAALAPVADIEACCMMPRDARGRIAQAGQQAVIFHYGNRQELVLNIDARIDAETTPDRFAWVVTVPDEPEGYRVEREEIYDETLSWALARVQPPEEEEEAAGSAPTKSSLGVDMRDLEFGALAKAGPYTIQPVRARGVEALGALNAWLEEHEFPIEDREHMEYFVANDFTFLAIQMEAAEGEEGVGRYPSSPPLHMSFESERPYYPLKFSSRMGPLDIDIVMFSDTLLDVGASKEVMERLGWDPKAEGFKSNVPVDRANLPSGARVVFEESAYETLTPPETWYLNVLQPRQVNADNTIPDWPEDVFLAMRAPGILDAAPWLPVALIVVVLAGGALWFVRSRKSG